MRKQVEKSLQTFEKDQLPQPQLIEIKGGTGVITEDIIDS